MSNLDRTPIPSVAPFALRIATLVLFAASIVGVLVRFQGLGERQLSTIEFYLVTSVLSILDPRSSRRGCLACRGAGTTTRVWLPNTSSPALRFYSVMAEWHIAFRVSSSLSGLSRSCMSSPALGWGTSWRVPYAPHCCSLHGRSSSLDWYVLTRCFSSSPFCFSYRWIIPGGEAVGRSVTFLMRALGWPHSRPNFPRCCCPFCCFPTWRQTRSSPADVTIFATAL
jgi:hypothetical protein